LSLWKVIAKNEIRLKTSRFRKRRRLLYLISFSILLFWGIYLGPALFDAILPEILKNFIEEYGTFIIPLIEYIFTSLFLMYMIYPLFILFRKTEIKKKEILLSSPIKSGDIFLGEFLGRFPSYLLFLLGVGPFGISLVAQVNPQINLFHHLIFYLSFFIMSIFGSLIGTIIANWIESRFLNSRRLQNFGKLALVLLGITIVGSFYIIHYIFELIIIYPELKKYLIFYPSFWYSNIILYFIDPFFIKSYSLNFWVNVGLAVILPSVILYISYKKAHYFYELKNRDVGDLRFLVREKKYHNIIGKITPRRYKGLVLIQTKLLFRSKENTLKLLYISGIIAIFGILTSLSIAEGSVILEKFLSSFPIEIQIKVDKNLMILVLSWTGGIIVGLFLGMQVFMASKNILQVYQKSLIGVKGLIYSYLISQFFLIIFLDAIMTFFFTVVFRLEILFALLFFTTFLINSFIILSHAIGIQCIRPLFAEKRKNMLFNNYTVIFLQIFSLYLTLYIFIPLFPALIEVVIGFFIIFMINLGISLTFSILILHLGIRRLSKLE
jgi:hypothetical protein